MNIYEMNKLTKALQRCLKLADDTVACVDYLKIRDKDLLSVRFLNGKIQYADITGKSPFDATDFLLGCMAYTRFETMFLTNKQVAVIQEEIDQKEAETALYTDELLYDIKSNLSEKEISSLFDKAVTAGVIQSIPIQLTNTQKQEALTFYLSTSTPTSIDILFLKNILSEIKQERVTDAKIIYFEEFSDDLLYK